MAIILGIDPGSRVTGYGLIRQQGRQLSYIASGCIRTVVDDMPTRLKLIYAGVSEIIAVSARFLRHRTGVYGQEPGFGAQARRARGVAIVAAVNQNLEVFEYAARQVKQTVVGTGAAERRRYSTWCARCSNSRPTRRRTPPMPGHRHHPLPPQPERAADERRAVELARGRLR